MGAGASEVNQGVEKWSALSSSLGSREAEPFNKDYINQKKTGAAVLTQAVAFH
jgi:hypothetical protein